MLSLRNLRRAPSIGPHLLDLRPRLLKLRRQLHLSRPALIELTLRQRAARLELLTLLLPEPSLLLGHDQLVELRILLPQRSDVSSVNALMHLSGQRSIDLHLDQEQQLPQLLRRRQHGCLSHALQGGSFQTRTQFLADLPLAHALLLEPGEQVADAQRELLRLLCGIR
ncbi:hypothetical protein ACFWZA_01595 [[Kitasatospora] papulosa]|uniref:hypothetical protein n=1 Tax=[Kitasatospora] papulosa TaxID=1464011 RepID=UPI00368E0A9A